MIDPVRPEVKAAIEKCRTAGIRPIMITGDHIDTAVAIATELGILAEDTIAVSGSALSDMNDEEFGRQFRKISVYARVQPEHKVRIVNAWRGAGYVTAMTGDGVNDAPSIKSADIGVGMGITGTDVTKNVADMVLADDNFATIVSAVEEGRRIYDNIRKVIQFLLSSNMSEVISIFAATLLGFSILRPVHLLWINLVRPIAEGRRIRRRHGRRHRIPGPDGRHPDAGRLFHRPLHGVRPLGNRKQRRRYDDGLFDDEHGRDIPQLQYAVAPGQHFYAEDLQLGPQLGRYREPRAHDACDLRAVFIAGV